MTEYTNIETRQFRGDGFMTVSKYNNSGDIIYIADKDSKCIVAIETNNYNIIGSFDGHNGVIWSLDISFDDKILISCSGDLSICFWETNTGTLIYQNLTTNIPKYVCSQKNASSNLVAIICDGLGKKSNTFIAIYDLNMIYNENFNKKINIEWDNPFKPSVLTWLNESTLIIGTIDGKIIIKNINNIEEDQEYKFHNDAIKSISWNKTKTQILTSSLDKTAKQINLKTWEIIGIYNATVPINYACWNHNDRKILIGGGIDAMSVAKNSNNDFNLKIYRTTDQKLMNHISSHFGPIRYIDKSPSNKNFVTASQDGTVKIYIIKDNDTDETLNITNEIKINNFGSIKKYQLSKETNKLLNLSWKPKQKVKDETKINWVPGMPAIDSKSKSDNYSYTDINYKNDKEVLNEKETESYSVNSLNEKYFGSQNDTIRITNLPYDIQINDLFEIFDFYGRIYEKDGIKIKNYGETTMAFIKYVYPESAQKAIDNANRLSINNYIIGVEYATKK